MSVFSAWPNSLLQLGLPGINRSWSTKLLAGRSDAYGQLREHLEVRGVESVDRLNAVRFHRRDDLQIENVRAPHRAAAQEFNQCCHGAGVDRENGYTR